LKCSLFVLMLNGDEGAPAGQASFAANPLHKQQNGGGGGGV
jgi:hypothetical protein